MRDLKYHEQKLMKKVNLYNFKSENNQKEVQIMRKYHLQDREDYSKYNKMCGLISQIVAKVKTLPSSDAYRIKQTDGLINKCFQMGLITNKKGLVSCEKIPVSAFCRRRLTFIVKAKLKMAETLQEAVTMIEQGHIRVGTETITDPAYHVSRSMEDYVNWVHTSTYRKKVLQYNNKYDDFDINQ